MKLNTGGIIAPSNVYTKDPLEHYCDTQTQVDGIWS